MKKLIDARTLVIACLFGLSINGNAQPWTGFFINSPSYRNANVAIGGNFNGTNVNAQLILANGTEPRLRFERANPGFQDFEIYATSGGQLRFRGGADGTNLTDHMIINGSGDVMIGTDQNPSSIDQISTIDYKLFVEGGILTDELLVRTGWADYVFDPDYQLLPLEKVATHIQRF
ncbi:MAG: hypothetical protein AAGD05_11405, partial [Bacteroidota bacterium]